jgi:hypothetical protein
VVKRTTDKSVTDLLSALGVTATPDSARAESVKGEGDKVTTPVDEANTIANFREEDLPVHARKSTPIASPEVYVKSLLR